MSRCIPSDVRSAALVTFVLCIYMAFSTPFGAEQPWLQESQDGTVGNNTTEAGLREELTREREAHARTRAVSPTSPLR
ncbi:hypothetical protein T484DRAFT_1862290 [Baffinella frigidus]|nr:hypothetical protein T484DRAFT_1862290 [Cryptophyta sp. CCMP2293]